MARRVLIVLIVLLPVLFFLSLLADARDILLPSGEQENKVVDDPLVLHDAFEQNRLSLPSERKNEMKMDVRQIFRRPWYRYQSFNATHNLRGGASDFISRPREREGDFISPLREREGDFISPLRERERERESDSIFLGEEGRKGLRIGRPGCQHHHYGGEMKFRHEFQGDGDHLRFRPQFVPTILEDPPLRREEAVSSSFPSFPGGLRPRAENEESRFEPRERAFERIGKGFPEREHNYPHGQGQWEFPNGEEHNHGRYERHEYPHGGEMKSRHFWGHGPREDPPRFRPQFPRPSFPSSGYHGKEAVSSSFNIFPREFIPRAENEESGFQPRERAFEHNFVKPVFPDREHSHGQWEFLNGEEHKYERHENHHGDERKFGHFPGDGPRGNHIHFRPQFPRSSSFPSSGDHGIQAVSSSFRRFPGEFLPRAQNEISGFQRRERAFEHMGGKPVFPEREHRHVQWEFLNGEEHKHDWRHENRHGDERKFGHFPGDGPRGDHLHFRQFPRSSSFPSSGEHGKEAVSSSFRRFPGEFLPGAENEKSGFQPRERAFGHIFVKPVFPDREHSHGPWKFPNGEEDKHGRHEDPPAPWTDWVRSLFGRH